MKWGRKIALGWVCLISLVYLWQNFTKSPWREGKIIRNDAQIYYSYLPATFIQNDPFFERTSEYDSTDNYWLMPVEHGMGIPKMSMGVAFLAAPFFFVADNYVKTHPKYTRDGFSKPYQLAFSFGTVCYTILGLFGLCFFLSKRFTPLIVSVCLTFLAFGTNLYFSSIYEPGSSHTYTFCLLTGLLLCAESYLLRPTRIKSVCIGLLFGWIVLIRPVNLLFVLPVFMLFKPKEMPWKQYFLSYLKHRSYLFYMLLSVFLVWLPQLLFWKEQTGHFLYYSYTDEGFFWLKPHVWDGLFSFRKGWFIYTPMMLFACFGFFSLHKTQRQFFWSLLLFLPVFLYITFSWWCWWYGGSFSARTLIDILPFMALPLAALLAWIIERKWRWILFVFPLFFIRLNLFQSWQYSVGFLHYDSMTYEGYKRSFFMDYTTVEYFQALRVPDYENAKKYGVEKKLGRIPI